MFKQIVYCWKIKEVRRYAGSTAGIAQFCVSFIFEIGLRYSNFRSTLVQLVNAFKRTRGKNVKKKKNGKKEKKNDDQ